MDQIKVKSIKKTKKGTVSTWTNPKASDLKNVDAFVDQLKKEKKTFKFVEKNVEKTYTFNGNNYIVTSKTVQ